MDDRAIAMPSKTRILFCMYSVQSVQHWRGLFILASIHIHIHMYHIHVLIETCMGDSKYRIAGKFGGDLNLAVWRSFSEPPNLISPKCLLCTGAYGT